LNSQGSNTSNWITLLAINHTKEHIKYGEENKTIADNGDNLRRTTRRQSPRSNSVLIKTSSDQMNLKFHFLTAL
jgi:cell division protein ZapA (FtsZ GTPase activity inhibitor)